MPPASEATRPEQICVCVGGVCDGRAFLAHNSPPRLIALPVSGSPANFPLQIPAGLDVVYHRLPNKGPDGETLYAPRGR